MTTLHDLLAQNRPLLADGAMGTMLFAAGLQFGDPPEMWNVLYPERVRAIQRQYIEAGSDIVLTNTFGGTRFRLKLHNLHNRVYELNAAAVRLLREEIAASGRAVLVAGDIGPSGEIMEPVGTLSYAEAVDGFEEQARALIEAGADLIWIETMSALDEVQAAIEGTRRVNPAMPIVATLSFDTHGCTMMGVTPEHAAQQLLAWGVTALGANCGNGTDELLAAIQRMHRAYPQAVLVAKSNAGMPQLVNGKAEYHATPDEMARYALQARAAGACIIGGCCGSNPNHIHAMHRTLQANPNPEPLTLAEPVPVTATDSRVADRAARRAARRSSP